MEYLLYLLKGKQFLARQALLYFGCDSDDYESINENIRSKQGIEIGNFDKGLSIYGTYGHEFINLFVEHKGVKIFNCTMTSKKQELRAFNWSGFIKRNPELKKTYILGIIRGGRGIKEYKEFENFMKDMDDRAKIKQEEK